MMRIYENLPRCTACGQLEGMPHVAGWSFAKYKIRRSA
jgi:hypothetical protein